MLDVYLGDMRLGVTITRAFRADMARVLAFETATFPSWIRWFSAASPQDILPRGTVRGNIAGTLLVSKPRCRQRIRADARPGRRDHRLRRLGV